MIKETRKLYWNDLRQLCIKRNWYTKGTNEEYSYIFKLADRDEINTETIVNIAKDIYDHSDERHIMPIESMCFEIAEICHSFFEEII